MKIGDKVIVWSDRHPIKWGECELFEIGCIYSYHVPYRLNELGISVRWKSHKTSSLFLEGDVVLFGENNE